MVKPAWSAGQTEHAGPGVWAGRTVQGGQSVEEGGAREELEKDVAKGFGRPNLAFGPGLLCQRPGDFEAGSGLAEAALLSVLHFLPRPWLVTTGFLPELSRSESESLTPPCGQLRAMSGPGRK